MLVVPISGKIGWKNPPMVTLLLLAINCLVFFLFQTDDDIVSMSAEDYYLESGLAEIEVPRYIDYLNAQGIERSIDELDQETLVPLHFEMEADADFIRQLMTGRIVTPQDPEYDHWQELRRDYEEKRNRSVAFAYGLRPAFPRVTSFFSYMFLHGGMGHLVGNMMFLWILGCMLEMGAGIVLFTIVYIVSGLAAAAAFYLVYPEFTAPLVGASGAIAGLMGAYTVLYGRKMVRVFYSLGFYFNTARIPAISLLPLWIGNECYQLFFGGTSHVAYVAHIGGLVAGALLAFSGERLIGSVDRDHFEEAVEDKIGPMIHQALEHMGNLEMQQATELLDRVLGLSPDNRDALTHLFNIHKLNPDGDKFHQIARHLIRVLLTNPDTHVEALKVYTTYAGVTGRPSLSIVLYLQIAGAMAMTGQTADAEKILLGLLKKKPDTPGLPSSFIKLADAFRQAGKVDRWKHCRHLVCKHFPDSVEATIVKRPTASG